MKKRKTVSAYMTLEISLLFPIIITSIVIMLYFVFYSYNKTVAFQNAAITTLYGKVITDKDKMRTVLDVLNENQYIALEEIKDDIQIGKNTIQVVQNGSMRVPILSEGINNEMAFSEGVIINNINPVSYIRKIRKVKANENRNSE